MRWSQTGNYGVLPNAALPNTFLAHAYDLGDPWLENPSCTQWKCCKEYGAQYWNATSCGVHFGNSSASGAAECAAACEGILNTTYYMGPIHPRIKKPVGERLAAAAYVRSSLALPPARPLSQCAIGEWWGGGAGRLHDALLPRARFAHLSSSHPRVGPSLRLPRPGSHGLVYGGTNAIVGPTLSGCTHNTSAATITVRFNASLLTREGRVIVKPYDRATVNSAMRVLVEVSFFYVPLLVYFTRILLTVLTRSP